MINPELKLVFEPYAEDENEHVIETKTFLKANFNDSYNYIKRGPLFLFFSFIANLFVLPILFIAGKIYYGVKVENRKLWKQAKKGGAVICSNHTLGLDMAMIAASVTRSSLPYHLATQVGFKIPVVRTLIKYLRAVPVPDQLSAKTKMYSDCVAALKSGKKIMIFPESSMWPYYHKIRNLKKGAFTLAKKAEVKIIPIVITFRKPKGIYKIWKRKRPCVTLKICPAVYPLKSTGEQKTANELLTETHDIMTTVFNESIGINN